MSLTNADRDGEGDIPIRRDPCQGQSEGVAGHDRRRLSLPEVVLALVLRFAMARARRGGWSADVGKEVGSEAVMRCFAPANHAIVSRLIKENEGSDEHRRAFDRLSTIVNSSYDAVIGRGRKHKLETGDVLIAETPSSGAGDGLGPDFRLDVEAAFRQLDPDEVRILRALQEGLPLTEIAEHLGITRDRAQTLLENARGRLRVLLRAYAPGPRSPRPETSPPSTT